MNRSINSCFTNSALVAGFTLLIAGLAAKAKGDAFTPAEQDLIRRGLTMEVYRPGSEVSHDIETIHGSKGSGPILVFVFGRADTEAARDAGHKLSAAGYTAKDAEQALLQQAHAKYPHSPFFVKCFMREAASAFNTGK